MRGQGGPPLWGLGIVIALFSVAAFVVSAALGGMLPSPYEDPTTISRYFEYRSAAVRASGILTFAASVPLSIFTATASARLRLLGVTAPGATIGLTGGVLAAGMLALSGLLQWVLARPEVRVEDPLVRALHDLAFLTGGPAHVVFFGLLLAGLAVPALVLRLVPRWLAQVGLILAAVAELSTLSLVWPAVSVLLPLARFPGLAWLVAMGFLLPHRRAPRSANHAPEGFEADMVAGSPHGSHGVAARPTMTAPAAARQTTRH